MGSDTTQTIGDCAPLPLRRGEVFGQFVLRLHPLRGLLVGAGFFAWIRIEFQHEEDARDGVGPIRDWTRA